MFIKVNEWEVGVGTPLESDDPAIVEVSDERAHSRVTVIVDVSPVLMAQIFKAPEQDYVGYSHANPHLERSEVALLVSGSAATAGGHLQMVG